MVADSTGYDWVTLIASSGIIASIFSITVNFYVRSKDEKKRQTKMLYYPLFLACEGIIEVTTNYKDLKEDYGRKLLKESADNLNQIVSNQGIIYLESQDLYEFSQLKKIIDINLQTFGTRNWDYIKDKLESKEFSCVKKYAGRLHSICQKKVKGLENLQGGMECH